MPRLRHLNEHWFLTLADAREKLEAWRRYYNEERPHGVIGNKVSMSLQACGGAASPSPWKQAGASTHRRSKDGGQGQR
jgi:putative transposase